MAFHMLVRMLTHSCPVHNKPPGPQTIFRQFKDTFGHTLKFSYGNMQKKPKTVSHFKKPSFFVSPLAMTLRATIFIREPLEPMVSTPGMSQGHVRMQSRFAVIEHADHCEGPGSTRHSQQVWRPIVRQTYCVRWARGPRTLPPKSISFPRFLK